MKTARTLQLLDANNNNISPATSIESLYFEMTNNNGVTYRMGIRDRMLVAGANALSERPQIDPSINTLKIPVNYISEISGAVSVYQMNSSMYDIGAEVQNYVHSTFDSNYIPNSASTNFVNRNLDTSGNEVEGTLTYVDSSGVQKFRVGHLDNDSYGILWNRGTMIGSRGNDTIFAEVSSGIGLMCGNVSIGRPGAYVDVSGNSTSIVNSSIMLRAATNIDVSANSSIIISSRKKTVIKSDTSVVIKGKEFDIDPSTAFFIYGKKFETYPLNTVDTQYLTYTYGQPGNTLRWQPLPHTTIVSGDSSADTSVIRFKDLFFGGDDKVSLLADASSNDSSVICFNTIGGHSIHSEEGAVDNIPCAEINGTLVIGTDIKMNFVSEDSSTWKNLSGGNIAVNKNGSSGEIIFKVLNGSDGTIDFYHDPNVTVNSGNIYAKKMFMSSDVRLKTDIKDAPVISALPRIRQFRWADTSVVSYGVIAQELEEIGLENLVSDNGDRKTVDYISMLCLMVRNLQSKIDELEDKLSKKC